MARMCREGVSARAPRGGERTEGRATARVGWVAITSAIDLITPLCAACCCWPHDDDDVSLSLTLSFCVYILYIYIYVCIETWCVSLSLLCCSASFGESPGDLRRVFVSIVIRRFLYSRGSARAASDCLGGLGWKFLFLCFIASPCRTRTRSRGFFAGYMLRLLFFIDPKSYSSVCVCIHCVLIFYAIYNSCNHIRI